MKKNDKQFHFIGKDMIRPDGLDRITGRAKYLDDYVFDNMLYATIVGSEIAHGHIKSIDLKEAFAVPGVVEIATAADIPGKNQVGCVVQDQPFLAVDKVRHIGDPIAIVAAETQEAAHIAAKKVKITYQELPGIFDPVESFHEKKNLIHESGNINCHFPIRKGNWQDPLRGSEVIVEEDFFVHHQEQMYMEGQGAIVLPPDMGGSVTIYSTMQCPFYVQKAVAKIMDLPFTKVRAIQTFVGGGFGGKEDIPNEITAKAALLAKMTNRPVKLVMTREDDIKMTSKRHPMKMIYRGGFTKKGKLKGMECICYGDSGSYVTLSTVVLFRSSVHACGPYDIPNVSVDVYGCYTNHVPSGAYRGFGSPQVIFGVESFLDKAALVLGIDPIELRLINAVKPGRKFITGQKVETCALAQTIEEARDAANWQKKRLQFAKKNQKAGDKLYGIGIASCYYGMTLGAKGWSFDKAAAHVLVNMDGSVQLQVGNTDMGQGSLTVLPQLLAESLGCPVENIFLGLVDTKLVPDSGPTVASRTTVMSGNAILNAAQPLRERMINVAAEMLKVKPSQILLEKGIFSVRSKGAKKSLTFNQVAEACYMKNVVLGSIGHWHVRPLKYDIEQGIGEAYFDYCFATHIAEVEVDRGTGEVKIIEAWCAHDSGKVINHQTFAGQVEGGFIQGAGSAVMENLVIENGRILTDNFTTYVIPSSLDVAKVNTIFIENPSDYGPYGAKGVGEISLMPAAAAVASAIGNAIGQIPCQLPILPEFIHQLRKGGDDK